MTGVCGGIGCVGVFGAVGAILRYGIDFDSFSVSKVYCKTYNCIALLAATIEFLIF